MEGDDDSRFFLAPEQTFHRRYEALRALVVDGEPVDRVAARFGYKTSALRSLISRFRADRRRGVTPPFFSPTAADDPAGTTAMGADRSSRPRRSPTAAS
ncbi:MAG TPA: hypothetical protein VFH70_08330 [Acidimicrobiales bacterium]|nr:hypothetical protein [Acidimicrobiales bacterium]